MRNKEIRREYRRKKELVDTIYIFECLGGEVLDVPKNPTGFTAEPDNRGSKVGFTLPKIHGEDEIEEEVETHEKR